MNTNYLNRIVKLVKKYHEVGTPEYGELMKELRTITILTEVRFRKLQKQGGFTDGTGDQHIASCLETLVV